MRNIIQLSSSTQSVHTFHLVCMQKSKNNNQKNHTIKNQSSAIGNNLMSSRNQSQSSPSSIDGSPETSAMNSNLASIAAASAATGWNPLNNILFDPDNLMIQQSYQILLQQYYQFIIPYLLVSPPIDFASYTAYNHAYLQSLQDNNNLFWQSNLNSQSNNNNGQNTQQNNNGGAAPEPAIAPMDRNVLENHDELIHRDWVDWMYAFSKVIILFSIFYFNSSFNRMILFVSILMIVLFFKNILNGYIQDERQFQQRRPEVNNNNENNNDNSDDNNNSSQNHDGNQRSNENETRDNGNSSANNNIQEAADQESNRFAGLRFVLVFITSLFTSLIPDTVPVN